MNPMEEPALPKLVVEPEKPAPVKAPPPKPGRKVALPLLSWKALTLAAAVVGILIVGAAFRFTNLHWDENLLLHPDERFLTMVEENLSFPDPCRGFLPHLKTPDTGGDPNPLPPRDLKACLLAYMDSSTSTLNPRNTGHDFWVYGTLPILMIRTVTEAWNIHGLANINIPGRIFSGLADMACVLFAFLIGKRLFGSRVGLLAALFLALSVLNIQNSHFFTVDTFTALMTVLCVYLAIIIAEGKGKLGTFILFGVVFGIGIASKLSVAAFALVITLAGGVRAWRRMQQEQADRIALGQGEEDWETDGQSYWPAVREALIGLVVAAAVTLLVFRVTQPDSFPNGKLIDLPAIVQAFHPDPNQAALPLSERLLNAVLDPRYVGNLQQLKGLISGQIDYYPGHQWTNRTALVFPWKNMVIWGMGLPLGLAGWAGLVLATWQLFRKKDLRAAVPIAWTWFLFLYQGIQFVKTMRYFLPLYPLLCVFAGYLLVWLWDRAREREPRLRVRTAAAGALMGVVVLGTFLWATAFIQIYLRPTTRAAASRWIFSNIPPTGGAWITLSDGSKVTIDIPNAQTYSNTAPTSTTAFTVPANGASALVTIGHLEDVAQSEGEEQLQVTISTDPGGNQVLGQGVISGNFTGNYDSAAGSIALNSVPLEADKPYYLILRGIKGSVRTWAVAVADEGWDDPIPMSVDGQPTFSVYRGIMMQPYGEDKDMSKVEGMLHQMANVDYIFLTSNRLYLSIPRLPMRYPFTTRYYKALFDGSLGYELVETVSSYPTLLGLPIPDDNAEEAFTVYDHPKVLIFKRTDAFSIEKARTLLTSGIDFSAISTIRPIDVPKYRSLLLTDSEVAQDRQGGTWSELFNPNGWTNRFALPVWLLVVELLGLAVFPLTHFLLGRLADGGFLPAKVLGFLLLGYLSWLLSATKLLPFTRAEIIGVLGLLVVAGAVVGWLRRKELLTLVRERRDLLLLEEALFLGAFLLFLFIRMGNPDLWHPWFGGEKPMDLAYLNAIVRSTTMPPYDPWFSGGYLNYYYFGQVLVATMIKLTGIVPAVAYNLALPMLYGFTCAGVFTAVYHLVARGQVTGDGWNRRAVFAGLAGVVGVAILGNLGQYMIVLKGLGDLSKSNFSSSIPGLASLVKAILGLPHLLRGEPLPVNMGWWYWRATRVIQEITNVARPATGGEINEFPFFTFLYADLHAHLIALPITLLALTQIIAFVKDPGPAKKTFWALLPPPGVILGLALVLGTLRAANFWDFPTYLLLALLGWGIALYVRKREFNLDVLVGGSVLAVLLAFLSSLLYQPFWARYGAYYNSVTLWTGERTRVGEFLIINGLFVFILVSYLLIESFRRGAPEAPLHLVGMVMRYWDRLPTLFRRLRRWGRRLTALPALLWSGVGLLLLELYFFIPVRSPDGSPLPPPTSIFSRLRGEPLLGWLLLLAVLGLLLFFRRKESAESRLTMLLVLLGMGIAGGVEVLVVKNDIARQNTSFKFYMQLWVLWGVAAAAMLPVLWDRLKGWTRGARNRWAVVLCILVSLCALYPFTAAPAKIRDRFPDNTLGAGLDGEAFMQTSVYPDDHGPIVLAEDAAAMRWMEENVQGTPVVMEGNTVALYRWGSRFAIHTGLPTIVGWDWHQTQQRGGEQVQKRMNDLAELYNTTDVELTLALLRKYQVSYIVVGQLERYYYSASGLAKFQQMTGTYLEQVYPAEPAPSGQEQVPVQGSPYPGPLTGVPPTQVAGTVIYRVLPSVSGQ